MQRMISFLVLPSVVRAIDQLVRVGEDMASARDYQEAS